MQWPGFWELLMLGVLALLIFGPDRLPGMAYKAGQIITRFKSEAAGTLDELKAAAELEGFSDVARDLRQTGDELRSSVDVRGLAADVEGAVKPRTAVMSSARSDVAPPFDPDTP